MHGVGLFPLPLCLLRCVSSWEDNVCHYNICNIIKESMGMVTIPITVII